MSRSLLRVYRIRAAAGLAAAEVVAVNADRDRTEAELTLDVTRLYLGILVAQAKVRAANTIVESRAAAGDHADEPGSRTGRERGRGFAGKAG